MHITIVRKGHFNAAHRLYVAAWSEEKNQSVFGLCTNPYFHGHNYIYEVYVTGPLDPISGMVMNLTDLSEIMKEYVEDVLDHKNLNVQVAFFKEHNPTAENICIFIYNALVDHLPNDCHCRIKLWETERNMVIYPACDDSNPQC